MSTVDKIKAGLAERGGGGVDGDLPSWSQEAHAAAANIRQALTGVRSDEEINRLALEAANAVMARTNHTEEQETTEHHPVSEQQRRGHGQEGRKMDNNPDDNQGDDDNQEPLTARDRIKAGLKDRQAA